MNAARWFYGQSIVSSAMRPDPAPAKPSIDCMVIDRFNPETDRFDEVYVERCGLCGTYHEPPMCAFSTAKGDGDVQF